MEDIQTSKKNIDEYVEWNMVQYYNYVLTNFYCIVVARLVEDVDLQLLTFSDFGKDVPKTFKLSPDGFVQMAIQLAYYKYALCSTTFNEHVQ